MAKLNLLLRICISSTVLALLLLGCTPKSETTTMNVAMPDWGAVASGVQAERSQTSGASKTSRKVSALANALEIAVVTRVMINVSGPNMPTQVTIWDIKDYNYSAGNQVPTPPTSFSFSVERGANRVFQALAIVQQVDLSGSGDTDGKAMTFFYGDVTKSLSLNEENLNIALVNQGTANGDEGSISGRFIGGDGKGPSGKLNMFYVPPTGPEMIVDSGTVFSGFFHVSLPSSAKFSFRTADGISLFNQINADSFQGNLGAGMTKVHVPAGYRDNGTGTRRQQGIRTRLAGFVGPGAAGKKVCYDQTLGSLSNLYVTSSAADSTRVPWDPASTDNSFAHVLSGGVATSDGLCPGGSGEPGADYFELRTQLLPNGDSSIGIRGPFSEVSPASDAFLTGSFSGGTLQLGWKYLKPTIGDSVAGVGIFTKTYAANETVNNRWSDSAPCSKLVSDFGFTEVTRVAAGTAQAPAETYTLTGIAAVQYLSGRHLTVVCPYSPGGNYFDFALLHRGGSNAQTQLPATEIMVKRRLSARGAASVTPSSVAVSTCTAMSVRMVDANGNDGFRLGAMGQQQVMLTLNGGGGNSYLYTDPQCGSGSPTLTLNSFGDQNFYLQLDPAVSTFTIVADDVTSGGSALPSKTFYGSAITAGTPNQLFVLASATINANECSPILLIRTSVAGEIIQQGGSVGSVSHSNDIGAFPGLNFYTSPTCVSPVSNSAFGSVSQAALPIFVKYTGALSSILINPDGSSLALTTMPNNLNVSQPGPASLMKFSMPPSLSVNSCVPVQLNVFDSQGRAAPLPAMATVNFGFSPAAPGGSGIFSDPSCTASLTSLTLGSGVSASQLFFVHWTAVGPVSVSETAFNGVVPVSPFSFVVTP
ncbi:hypothetical protein BH10BDE1_BH10BDE1_14860 [soil metagenome]